MLLIMLLPAPIWAGWGEGYAAYDRGDYVTAMNEFRPLAEQGWSNPQYFVGKMYDYGLGISEDDREASGWYLKAANQGNDRAQNSLGRIYEEGHGVPQDYSEAIRWYRKAAEEGLSSAQFNLAEMYYHGRGVEIDFELARTWYQKAATQGNSEAIAALRNVPQGKVKQVDHTSKGTELIQLQDTIENIVDICVNQVKREITHSTFDAYVQGKTIRSFGTAEDRFKFDKCMARHNYPLEYTSPQSSN